MIILISFFTFNKIFNITIYLIYFIKLLFIYSIIMSKFICILTFNYDHDSNLELKKHFYSFTNLFQVQ